MLNLDGVVSVDMMHDIMEYTDLRFADKYALRAPEALTLHEEGVVEDEVIKSMCERLYGLELYEPVQSYVPDSIIRAMSGSGAVPVIYQPMQQHIIAVYSPEFKYSQSEINSHTIEYLPTTIYYYFRVYQKNYGAHNSLKQVPPKTLFDGIVKEAIRVGAVDITITNVGKSTEVYYNVRKRKVNSRKVFDKHFIQDVINIVTVKSPMDTISRIPKYVDVSLNEKYRGRIIISNKFGGHVITIRLLPNEVFSSSLEDWNLASGTIKWLRDNILDKENGLRLLVGETMSGKNTTALSLLREIAEKDIYKIISVECPVEQELPGVEQINTETPEEYDANIKSLIHQNPDFVYITEIKDATGLSTIQITNTGKCVLSTLHANSVADTISRLIDITGLSQDRIIQSLHSICYQELVRDGKEDRVFPRNRFVRFDSELKYELYGKSLGEALKIIRGREGGDEWNYARLTKL